MSDMPQRRVADGLLVQLFEQNAEQHRQNTGTLNGIRDMVQALAIKDENHSGRLGNLEEGVADLKGRVSSLEGAKIAAKGESKGRKAVWASIYAGIAAIAGLFGPDAVESVKRWIEHHGG